MTHQDLTLRRAVADDADAVARVFSPSRRLLTFLPELHTIEEDHWFITNRILVSCEVTVVECGGEIVSFIAREHEEIRLLHTHPDFVGRGAGARLIEAAKGSGTSALELWCFQANRGARRFYEAHGFHPIGFTDGSRNEEQTPDVRYRWDRPQ